MSRIGQRLGCVLLLLVATFYVAGCASDVEKLAEHCEAFWSEVENTRDCEALGGALGEHVEAHNEWVASLAEMPAPEGDEKAAWEKAFAPCLRARLELSVGVCRNVPEVSKHIEALP